MILKYLPDEILIQKFSGIRAVLLDWDGVFNNGFKKLSGSGFSETDSMGLNLLRYALFRLNGKMPVTALISGENNAPAFFYATREKFQCCYYSVKDKTLAWEDFLSRFELKDHEVLYFYDDVLDLPVARRAGLRGYVAHPARKKLETFLIQEKLLDFSSDLGGDNHALREMCEFLIDMSGQWKEILKSREQYDNSYKEYIHQRNTRTTLFLTLKDNRMTLTSYPQ